MYVVLHAGTKECESSHISCSYIQRLGRSKSDSPLADLDL